jgi:colicin import membrane protein
MALFLGTASTIRQAPRNINLFATGATGDEDLGQNIIMKGDKFHYNQFSQVEIEEGAPNPGVRFVQNRDPEAAKTEEKKDAKEPAKEEKKDAKDEKKDAKDEKKDAKEGDEKKDAKEGDEKKDAKEGDEKKDAKDDKKDAKDEKKDEKKDGDEEEKKEEEKKEDGEEKKEEKKDQKPGEATWEDHNGCKENEWEAADGNCAFEAENVHLTGNNSILNDHKMLQLGDLDQGLQFVQLGNGSGLWMNKKFSDDKINGDFTGKIDSVAGPPGAPIGFGVHKLASSIDPYSAKKTVEMPAPGIQHQPIILPAD